MTPERWQQIREILDAALECEPRERTAFLDRACGPDEDLRREVDSLMAEEQGAADFLEPRGAPETRDQALAARLRAALRDSYRIDRELGRGGMSTVYLAHDVKHGRQVAIKVLHHDAPPSSAQRFRREIEVLARLQHPNILPLHDSGAVAGTPYYVMPFIEGESLRSRLGREPQLSIDESVRIAHEVADALGHAHAQGIVHRDIKPENILLSGGHAIVADFGIGKSMLTGQEATLTATGLVIGTPLYVSPEQGAGERDIDGRSDLYSLGIVLYEMLIGEPPFTGPTPQAAIVKRFTDPVPSLRAQRPAVPEALERVVLTLLARGPEDRFRTAADVIDALTAKPAAALATAERSSAAVRTGAATGHPPPSSAAVAAPSIVVLPFANMSANPDDEYLADGITEEIINALTRLRTVRVVARTSAFAFKGKAKDVRAIARRLEVGSVLEGSVRRSGTRLRIAAELIDAADGCRIWAEQIDREVDDVFSVQDDLSRRIVESLQVTLLGGRARALVDPLTASPQAYELYLKGRYCWHRRTERDLVKGIAYFEEAIARDPRFALAFAGLADSYAVLCIYGFLPSGEGMPRAQAAARTALELNPSLAEAHTTLACIDAVYEWNWGAAEREFQRAVMLNPQHPAVHHRYALDCLTPLGRFAEASAELAQARALDPLSLVVNTSVGLPPYFGRRFDDAARAYLEALDLDPSFGIAHYFLGQVHTERGMFDDAIAAFRKAIELVGRSAEVSAALAYAYGASGQPASAEAALRDLLQMRETRYVSPCLIAQVHLGLGRTDDALEWLERGCEERAADLIWLGVRPVFDRLRSHARFRALTARVGLG